MDAFLVGSHAYGTPTPESDIDIVVMVSQEELPKLRELAGDTSPKPDSYGNGEISSASLRFGNLNLIVVTSETDWRLWKNGCQELKRLSPVTRDFAIEYFRRLRAKRGEHDPFSD